MTLNLEFERLLSRLRAPLLGAILIATASCDRPDLTEPIEASEPAAVPEATVEPAGDLEPAFATAYQGGIPIGFFRQPNTAFGSIYSGAKQTIAPSALVSTLRQIKARGGKVVLSLADHEKYFKDSRGHFSFTKWKARIDRYRNINFSSFIKDGTITGHFMIDEPQDVKNWNGVAVSGATLEAMAKYSKQLWPGMATIVRAPPAKIRWRGTYRYLDAAWAQVENPRGTLDVTAFINSNVSAAKSQGLALVIGLNVSKGGTGFRRMTASQIRSWGSKALANSYPCAFLSWTYEGSYLATAPVRDAMRYLRSRAQSRGSKSCRS
jgi:hypothetical protein